MMASTKREVAEWVANPGLKLGKESFVAVKNALPGSRTPLTQEQVSAWDTTSGGPPPGVSPETWNIIPPESRAEFLAKARELQTQSGSSTDAGEESYVDQRQQRTDDFLYGSPDDINAYARSVNPALDAKFNTIEALGRGDFYSPAHDPYTPSAVALNAPKTPPGAIARVESADQKALADQQRFADELIGRNRQIYDNLSTRYSDLDAQDNALLSELRSTVGGINLPTWEAVPESIAARAYADPASIAAQNQALAQLQGAAGGSLDASSNPRDVANQNRALQMLFGAAGGSLDAHTNPEDLARQVKTADKLWGLTDPEITAEEKFIYEKQRLVEEQDRRGAMDAALRSLSARGQLGSGSEIGAMLGAQQQTSQNRLLGDLGAQANAIARSQNSLQMHSQLATAMRNASDAMTSGNMNRRLGGMEGAGNLSSNMRNASDAMATANMNRRLGGMEASGTLASNMRNSSFNEAYSRGQAADRVNELNQASRQNYGIAQANLGLDKAGTIFDAGRNITTASGNRAGSLAQTGILSSGQTYGAQRDTGALTRDVANDEFIRGLGVLELQGQGSKDAEARAELNRATAALGQRTPSGVDRIINWLTS